MVKKIAALAGAGAILLSMVVPVLAHRSRGSSDVAIVNNSAVAWSNTGGNTQGNGVGVQKAGVDDITVSGSNTMTTGRADAYAGALVGANVDVGCDGCSGGRRHRDFANVTNSAYADANTGINDQGNVVTVKKAHADDITVSGSNSMTTGPSYSKARAWTIVNTHLSF